MVVFTLEKDRKENERNNKGSHIFSTLRNIENNVFDFSPLLKVELKFQSKHFNCLVTCILSIAPHL
jgi:hypothetical protein